MAIAERPRGIRDAFHQVIGKVVQNPHEGLSEQNGHLRPHEHHNGHSSGHTDSQPADLLALPTLEKVRMSWSSEWTLRVEGYDSSQEELWRRPFTLSNGIITVVPTIDGSAPIAKQRGLFEQKPQEDSDTEFAVPAGLNVPDFTANAVRFGESELRKDLSTLVREFDTRYQTLTTSYVAYDGDGRAVDVVVNEFASMASPHVFVRKISFTPHYSDELTVNLGINGYVENNGHNFYQGRQAQTLEGQFGILYGTDTAHKRHRVAIAQRADLFNADYEQIPIHPDATGILKDRQEDPNVVYHQVTLPVKANNTYYVVDITSVHSSVDQNLLEGLADDPAIESMRDINSNNDYATLLSEHKAAWDRRRGQNGIEVDGDDELLRALRFNQGHVMSEVRVGYVWAGPAPKKGADKAYGDRSFWDELFINQALTPEQTATLVKYRHKLLPAAREKARYHNKKVQVEQGLDWPFPEVGGFWPWEAHFANDDAKNGEGGPPWVRNEAGRVVPIESIEEEIHISGEVTFLNMENFWRTRNEALMREIGAEIILESGRFYASRASYNQELDRYEYRHVTGPDEYHPGINNNGYTQVIAKWTMMQTLELVDTGMVSDELRRKIGLGDEEIAEMRKRAAKVYIPFDLQTLILNQFDGYNTLEWVDLGLPQYKGITAMDVKLREERTSRDKADEDLTPNERNPVRTTQVIKQPDSLLILDLLDIEFLNVLPDDIANQLRASGKTDEQIMEEIYRANFEKYAPQTCDGSSLSPNEMVRAALNAGVDPDKAYEKYQKAALIDFPNGENTYRTEEGLHMAAMGASIGTARGFAGERARRDALVVNPKLPSHWQGMQNVYYYAGQQYRIDIDRKSDEIAITLLDPSPDAYVPVTIRGHRVVLDAQNRHHAVPFTESPHNNGSNGHIVFDGESLHAETTIAAA